MNLSGSARARFDRAFDPWIENRVLPGKIDKETNTASMLRTCF
jgi:hypothetical protein